MLTKHITLHVLNKILKEESKIKLRPQTRMYYIEFLTLNFKDKEPFITNLCEFEVSGKIAIQCKNELLELVNAGLIKELEQDKYLFLNYWSKHMDLSKITNDFYLPETLSLEFIHKELLNSQQLFEVIKIKSKVTTGQIGRLLELFIQEQSALQTTYFKLQDAKRHFMSWVNYNKDKSDNAMKNKTKILGL
jgi:hypothetical protein